MNITFQSKNHAEAATSDSEPRSGSVVSDFSEARHQLMLDSSHAARDKATRAVKNGTGQGRVPAGSSVLVDEAVYWLLTAPALAYVVYSAFGF